MLRKKQTDPPQPAALPAPVPPLLEPLLGVHSVPSLQWLADTASTAAERGLGALYSLIYLMDASGQLAGQRPASTERVRALATLQQSLDTDLTACKFDPQERPALLSALQEGHAVAVPELGQALPLGLEADQLQAAQRRLGIAEAWLVPLHWNGESSGLLLLLMPADPPTPLAQAELLGRHVAVALSNLREKEAGRKRGELDAVRWVYDERRFREQLAKEIRRAQRHKRPLSIMLLRIQNLEELRVRYGRFLAEQVLRRMGIQLADAMRDTDFLGAFRENGFAAILVEADEEGAQRAEQRLLTGVQTMKLPHADLPDMHIQLACATATLSDDGETAEELAAAAEAHLSEGATSQAEVA